METNLNVVTTITEPEINVIINKVFKILSLLKLVHETLYQICCEREKILFRQK